MRFKSGAEWAKAAGFAPSTVTRATADDYSSVTSLITIHGLARAADVPSPLDMMRAEYVVTFERSEAAEAIMMGILDALPAGLSEASRASAILRGLQSGADLLQHTPALAERPEELRAVARSLAAHLR